MKTKTKKNFLKLSTLTLVFFFAMNMAEAQVEGANYVVATDVITHHTVGKTLGFWVEPDMFYNPNYVAPGWVLNGASGWVWAFSDGAATTVPAENYVAISDLTVGNYTIEVYETNSTVGCDATPIDEQVVILPVPAIAVNAGASGIASGCGGLTGHLVSFTLSAEGLAGHMSAQWRLKEYGVTIDGATGDPITGAIVSETPYVWNKFTTSPQTIGGNEWAITENSAFVGDGTNAPALASLTLSMSRDYSLPVGFNAYLYQWEIDTAEGDGLNDRISRKSDFIDGGISVYGTDGTIDIYVVRAPSTGPIYHIPNSFGL